MNCDNCKYYKSSSDDQWAIDELESYIDNVEYLYERKMNIVKRLIEKYKNSGEAVLRIHFVSYLPWIKLARDAKEDYCDKSNESPRTFPERVLKAAAKEIGQQEYDNLK